MEQLFQVEDRGGATVTIRNVPIFRTHQDRQYQCDSEWLDRCCADFHAQKAASLQAWYQGNDSPGRHAILPTITIGHTSPGHEPQAQGFVDNLRRSGEFLYADFVDVNRDTYAQIKANKFPHRSVEVFPSKHRLASVALLGGNYPHLALPVMRFSELMADGGPVLRFAEACQVGGEEAVRYYFTESPNMIPNNNGGMNQSGMGGNGMGGGMGGGGMNLQALAQQIAPLVAQLLGQARANAAGGPMDNAGAYQEQHAAARYKGTDEVDETMPAPKKAVNEVDEKMPKDKESDMDKEKSALATLQEQAAKYKAEADALKADLTDLKAKFNELYEHKKAGDEASKLAMYTMQLRGMLTEGYAIGDAKTVERHAKRMMSMSVEDAKAYADDIRANAQRAPITRQGYSSAEVIHRPGSAESPEQYAADPENAILNARGVTADIARIAESLASGL